MKYAIIENGKVVNVTKADKPLGENWVELQDGFWIGDLYDGGVFSKAPVDIDAIKLTKREALKAERDEIEFEPVNNFQCHRPIDIIKIEKAIRDFDTLLAGEDGKTLWKMADNTYSRVSKAEMQALDPLQVVKVAKAYASEATALAQLEAAKTREEIDIISVRAIYEAM